MRILFLAPEPFYQDRGSPIAVNMVLEVLSQRGNWVDVITYPEGDDVKYQHMTLYRTPALPFIRNIRPGFSWQKVVCDFFMLVIATRLVIQNRYQLIHAVEEAVFIALIFKVIFKIPYVYDMDSSLPQQMTEKYPWLTPLEKVMSFFERLAVKHAKVVVPVCETLAQDIEKYQPKRVVLLPDVSLLR